MNGKIVPMSSRPEIDSFLRTYEIDNLQTQIAAWAERNWPDDSGNPLLGVLKAAKVAEEAGEVCGAAIKMGRPEQGLDELKAEVADVFITLVGVAEAYGFLLSDIIWERWLNDVRHRGSRGGR